MLKFKLKLSYVQIIALGFMLIIFSGAILLSLPISSKSGEFTPFIDSLFTSTSATCVTGLVVYDTFTHWSMFGKIIIILMIQLGGIGFMSVITMFAMFFRKQIGLSGRKLIMQSAGSLKIGGVVSLVKKIIFGTFIFEGIGAALLFLRFMNQMKLKDAIFYSIFHSISAFCNAGFDLMGKNSQFSSLTAYTNDVVVNFTIMALIVLGGIGFMVWSDVAQNRLKFRNYSLHSKIVLTATSILIFGGAILFFIFERNAAFANMPLGEQILASLFQSVTPRTAGFNTVDLNNLSESGSILTMVFMLIGGSPGSTAGGMKTTTFIVLIMGAWAAARHYPSINVFKRRMDNDVVKEASAIGTIYIFATLIATMVICTIEPFAMKQVFFEVFSAIGTVGLSLGITPALTSVSKIIIMFLMYCGRVGGLTLALVLAEKRINAPIERPCEKILIG